MGGTSKSEHRLLGDLPSLDISPTGNRRMQNMKDEEEIEKWRKKRKQELIERAAKNAEKKRQKEKRNKLRREAETRAENRVPQAESERASGVESRESQLEAELTEIKEKLFYSFFDFFCSFYR